MIGREMFFETGTEIRPKIMLQLRFAFCMLIQATTLCGGSFYLLLEQSLIIRLYPLMIL